MPFHHIPVLLQPTIDLIAESRPVRIVDATLGGAGHSSALLERLPDAQLLGIDRDEHAISAATERLAPYRSRVTICHGNASNLREIANGIGWDHADAVLMDIGVSSPQIDDPSRGFSFRGDGPLDMRMNQEDGVTAADILNTSSQEDLERILRDYGEEFKARLIAREIVRRREQAPWTTTGQLNELLEHLVGRQHQHGLPPATRTFQALRIAVNHELDELTQALHGALELLSIGGVMAIVDFHSLEDRIVKHFFLHEAATCVCPPRMPVCTCGKIQTLEILTKKPITASEEELKENPRAACAKMRAARKIHDVPAVASDKKH